MGLWTPCQLATGAPPSRAEAAESPVVSQHAGLGIGAHPGGQMLGEADRPHRPAPCVPAHGPHTSHVTATGSLNYGTPSTSPATAVTHPIQHFPKELEARFTL